jgi:DNA-binding NarL/FixJ family response regulator
VTPSQRENDVRHALELGVQGYLLLGCTPKDLLSAVRAVGRGMRWLCPEAATRMADSMAQDGLTPREEQVLRLLVAGCSNKVIGQSLDLALGTVKTHVKAIFQKLNARSRTEAISICMQRGLTAPLSEQAPTNRPARDQVLDLE